MASEPVNGEGNDGPREKQGFRVYTRKGKGLRKQTSSVAVRATDATEHREKPEGNLTAAPKPVAITDGRGQDVNQTSDVVPPVARAQEGAGFIAADENSVQQAAPKSVAEEDVRPFVAKTSIDAPSENQAKGDADTIAEKTSVESPSQAHVQDDTSLAVVDKNAGQPCPAPVGGDDVTSSVVEKSVEIPSQSVAQEDVNTVVIDKNSIKAPPENQSQDFNTVVVDKNLIEASSQTLSQEDANAAIVDKNTIEVPSEEDVNVVDADNTITEAPPETPYQREANDGQMQAEVPSGSVPAPRPLHVTLPRTQVDITGSIPIEEGPDGRIRIRTASSSRQQKQEIRRKLEDQLNLVRGLVRRIEAKEGEIGAYNNDSRALVNTGINNGGRVLTGFASAGPPREIVRVSRPLNQLSISVLENTQGANEHMEKEKRTPKANQFYRNSEFLLAKDKFPPADSNKKSKSSAKKHGGEVGHGFGPGSKVYKNCSSLLERLMKHKHGWVFNAPVDVKGLGLHDYFTIIKHPMDLGTIKSRLTKNWYKSPREFAEDVRLTFRNAMTYNPKGQDVHVMAEQLSKIFEDRWVVIEAEYNREMRFFTDYEMNLPTPRSRLAPILPPPSINVRSMMDRPDWSSRPADSQPKSASTPSGRTPALKKPKANEPNKRDMTYEEKQKLSANLQNLPPEKLDPIVQIVNKRNTAVKLRDEEIEVDIDTVDPETLWELDRFVTNYKKSLSKKKRKAELAIQARAEAERKAQQTTAAPVAQELPRESGTAQKSIPAPAPSQAEKPNHEGSRSSSSSSSSSDSSSSSSDSDSDSSSSSGSDQT